jgi:hypothetical protein
VKIQNQILDFHGKENTSPRLVLNPFFNFNRENQKSDFGFSRLKYIFGYDYPEIIFANTAKGVPRCGHPRAPAGG